VKHVSVLFSKTSEGFRFFQLLVERMGDSNVGQNAENGNDLQQQQQPLFFGKYEAIKAIGKGKFAIVYRGRHIDDDSVVAIKRVSVDMMNDKAREKCLKEVRLLKSLDHPNIIRYIDSFLMENSLIIIYEWAAAGDLKRQIRKMQEKGTNFEERMIWKYFSQISNAIQHMHSKRIMHRDLKPANIFLTLDGAIKLGDFGLSREFSEDTYQAYSKVGTPLYMSPEVIKGESGYDFKSDIWSLGCLLYELAVLKSPFKAEGIDIWVLLQKISNGEYQPVSESYSEELRNLVNRMISTNPVERPSIDEICETAARMRQTTANQKLLKKSQSKTGEEMNMMNGASREEGGGGGRDIDGGMIEKKADYDNENQLDRHGNNGVTIVNENRRERLASRGSNRREREREEKERSMKEHTNDDDDDKTINNSNLRGRNNGRIRSQDEDQDERTVDNNFHFVPSSQQQQQIARNSSSSSQSTHRNPSPSSTAAPPGRQQSPQPRPSQNPFGSRSPPLQRPQISPQHGAPSSSSRRNDDDQQQQIQQQRQSYQNVVIPMFDNDEEEGKGNNDSKKDSASVYRRNKPPKPESSSSSSNKQVRPSSSSGKNNSSRPSTVDENEFKQNDYNLPSSRPNSNIKEKPSAMGRENGFLDSDNGSNTKKSSNIDLSIALESSSAAFALMDLLYGKLIILGYPMTDAKIDLKMIPSKQRPRGHLLPIHFACNLQLFDKIAGHESNYQFQQFHRMIEIIIWLCEKKIKGKAFDIISKIDLQTNNSIMISKQLLLAAQVSFLALICFALS
jgi:serine/threonine protein kinase